MLAPPHAASVIGLTPQQVRSLLVMMDAFPRRMQERGKQYAASAHVGPLLVEAERVGARVRGTRVYQVWWSWDDGFWEATCDCPVDSMCKHQYAAACCMLEPCRAQAGRADRRLAREVLGEDGFARTLTRADLEYLLTPA
jgi:uncharacterized Zn finger protein